MISPLNRRLLVISNEKLRKDVPRFFWLSMVILRMNKLVKNPKTVTCPEPTVSIENSALFSVTDRTSSYFVDSKVLTKL